MFDSLEVMALKRKVKRLKNENEGAKRIIKQLNRELADNEATLEHYGNIIEEQFQELKKYKSKEELYENVVQATRIMKCPHCGKLMKLVNIDEEECSYHCESCKRTTIYIRV